MLIVLCGSSYIAYENRERDFDNFAGLGTPVFLFSKQLGHGGDLFSKNGGDITKIDVAWLNWHLKSDESAAPGARFTAMRVVGVQPREAAPQRFS